MSNIQTIIDSIVTHLENPEYKLLKGSRHAIETILKDISERSQIPITSTIDTVVDYIQGKLNYTEMDKILFIAAETAMVNAIKKKDILSCMPQYISNICRYSDIVKNSFKTHFLSSNPKMQYINFYTNHINPKPTYDIPIYIAPPPPPPPPPPPGMSPPPLTPPGVYSQQLFEQTIPQDLTPDQLESQQLFEQTIPQDLTPDQLESQQLFEQTIPQDLTPDQLESQQLFEQTELNSQFLSPTRSWEMQTSNHDDWIFQTSVEKEVPAQYHFEYESLPIVKREQTSWCEHGDWETCSNPECRHDWVNAMQFQEEEEQQRLEAECEEWALRTQEQQRLEAECEEWSRTQEQQRLETECEEWALRTQEQQQLEAECEEWSRTQEELGDEYNWYKKTE